MIHDYNELTQQEQQLKEIIQQKDQEIKLLQKEINELREREKNYLYEINYLKERNKEMSGTLFETNQSLEVLQNELKNLKLTIKSSGNQNKNNNNHERKGDDDNDDDVIDDFQTDQPDEASRTYSGDGKNDNNNKKHIKKERSVTYEISDGEEGDRDIHNRGDGTGVKGIRKRIQKKKKKDPKEEKMTLPNIHQRVNSSNHEEKDGSGSILSNLTDEKNSIIKSSQTRKVSTANEFDERQQQHQRLLELRLKSGGCTFCGKKIKGEPKRLPSSLKNLIIDGYESVNPSPPPSSSNQLEIEQSDHDIHANRSTLSRESERPSTKKRSESPNQSILAEVVFAGYPIVENHLDHQLAIRDKYSHPRGQHCIFCSWDCAK